MRIFLLLLLVSCGEHNEANRCFNQEEAILYCQVNELKEGISVEQAKVNCGAKYPIESCYYLD